MLRHPCTCPDLALISIMLPAALRLLTTRGPLLLGDDPAAPAPKGRLAARLYGVVRYYRTEVSPTRAARCPYTPSCSTYAVQALHRHGALRGLRLTAGRLLRCRPGAALRLGGVDPVPNH
ncbi:membrane protein insertion efficiency factor YidD [Streptomyces boninensis]|uniref:membrane protein insertion efficiency factor YidD n=1 Tax=Streptomyces boninensis TaxID=2039455 RepID=UPI003B215255